METLFLLGSLAVIGIYLGFLSPIYAFIHYGIGLALTLIAIRILNDEEYMSDIEEKNGISYRMSLDVHRDKILCTVFFLGPFVVFLLLLGIKDD